MTTAPHPTPAILRYAAFTRDPNTGNPAGVVLDAGDLTAADMLRIAAGVGFSETAFIVTTGESTYDVRYFSPRAEVPFCGHATIAAAVAMVDHGDAARGTDLELATAAGLVKVHTDVDRDGQPAATLTSVPTSQTGIAAGDLAEALAALAWKLDELDPELPPAVAYAGAHHLVLAAASRERLAELEYDGVRLGALMHLREWTTLQLVWRQTPDVFHARNPFPVGGVVEDPATGAAAAALGGYLRDRGLLEAPATLTIHQGEDMGRSSRLIVDIPAGLGAGVQVTGNAVRMP